MPGPAADTLLGPLSLLAGGLGLFLLGMGMMTDGLKLAAGAGLQRILRTATHTRWQALGSGVLVTALVQSSSAVTVATIGFVNAGLLALSPALWVLFGANVGTTMTGWIVALVGLKFKIEALALPLVGVGVLLRLGAEGGPRAAWGTALAGFGLLFLGIATLQQAFGGLGGQLALPQGSGIGTLLSQLGIGLVMTLLMQSSSAAMTVTLTAAHGGLIDAQGAAAVVIGANVGTTATALLATIGATPNARRAAAAHVLFNVVTGVVALLLLPWLIALLGAARQALGLPADPAVKLALFHTCFNLLGVALMWPVADRLAAVLQRHFRAGEGDAGQPRYLDDNVLAVPPLALDALAREGRRLGQAAVALLRGVCAGRPEPELLQLRAVVQQLEQALDSFAERISRSAMTGAASARLARLLRVQRCHEAAAEAAWATRPLPQAPDLGAALAERQSQLLQQAAALLASCDAADAQATDAQPLRAPAAGPDAARGRPREEPLPASGGAAQALPAALQALEEAYAALKSEVLAAGADGRLSMAAMDDALARYSALRRALQQAVAARQTPPTGHPA